jgi:hypothetical protein
MIWWKKMVETFLPWHAVEEGSISTTASEKRAKKEHDAFEKALRELELLAHPRKKNGRGHSGQW